MGMAEQDNDIVSLIKELFKETGFIASVKVTIPRGYTKKALSVLSNHADLLHNNNLSWKIEEILDNGVVVELDRTNYPQLKRNAVKKVKEE